MHILSTVTDRCPSWISGRGRMTVEMISWSMKVLWPSWYSNLRPWIYNQTQYRQYRRGYAAWHQETRKSCDWFWNLRPSQLCSYHVEAFFFFFFFFFLISRRSDVEARDFSGRYKRGLDKRVKLSCIFAEEIIIVCVSCLLSRIWSNFWKCGLP